MRPPLSLPTAADARLHSPWRTCVAPMMEWTDRACRGFHRLITRHTRLYTEMVNAGAVLHGGTARHLDFDRAVEHPVALQLGGSEPDDLARAAKLALDWGYDEVNLNCGCPSPRVQRGAFGACLMREPVLVRDAVSAMRDAVAGRIPITVKHRLGLGRDESEGLLRDFVGTVAEGGCEVFVVHARNAWLEGLSPKDNREIPPLRHAVAHALKRDFPRLTFVLNGGLTAGEPDGRDGGGDAALARHLQTLDGVMLGRAAYHDPASMACWDARLHGDAAARDVAPDDAWRESVEQAFVDRIARAQAATPGLGWATQARHMLGLWHGRRGARRWRQVWSDHRLAALGVHEVARRARAARLEDAPRRTEG